jgi:uncharacterized integral membrane protein (TIGR00697 family)
MKTTNHNIDISLLFLVMFQVTIYITATCVAYRMISFGPVILSGPPFIFPMTYAVSDIIAEIYGPKLAKQIIICSLVCQFIFAITVKIIVHLPSPEFWGYEQAYITVLNPALAFSLAGTIAGLAGSWINVNILFRLKIIFDGRGFFWRSIGSSAVGGAVTVLLIMIFGYSTSIDTANFFKMFLSIYLLELLYAIVLAIPARFFTNAMKVKTKEKISFSTFQNKQQGDLYA